MLNAFADPKTTCRKKRERAAPLECRTPEVILWHRLRRKPGRVSSSGASIQRGQFRTGFLLFRNARLAIEVDGISHDMGDNLGRHADFARDCLAAMGGKWSTLRVLVDGRGLALTLTQIV